MIEGLAALLQPEETAEPAYRQIADKLTNLIEAGTLPAGERLPPDRSLAKALGLSRTTIVAAYDELKANGLVHGRQGSGTYVARRLDLGNDNWPGLARPASPRDLGPPLGLSHAMPPLETTPISTLVRFMSEAAIADPESLVAYHPTEGYPPLRHELARMLGGWGLNAHPSEIMTLSGSQQGIDLLARLMLRPGDYVVTEAYTYGGALAALRTAGARLLPAPMDDHGLQVEVLASLLSRYPVRLIYTMATFHNPTGVTMPLERRKALLQLAARHAVPIIEDNLFDQIYFDQPPPPSLKALDRDGQVLALGSASKIVGAGLRLGWLLAPPATIEQVARLKRSADLQTNNLAQVAFERFLASGLMDRQLELLRQACRRRALLMVGSLRQRLPELQIARPSGGLYLWARLPDGPRAETVLEEANRRGVTFMPGSWFSVNGSDDGSLRLCFAQPAAEQLDEAVRRLADAVQAVTNRGSGASLDRLASHVPLV